MKDMQVNPQTETFNRDKLIHNEFNKKYEKIRIGWDGMQPILFHHEKLT